GAGDAALVTQDGADATVSVLHSLCGEPSSEVEARFARCISRTISEAQEPVVTTEMTEVGGDGLLPTEGWKEIVVARLIGGSGELLGALCLAGCKTPLDPEDQQLLKAIAGEASVSLENARFFTRMEQANRHWVEMFDAIADYIVAHDESGNVLRVNRALADLIGVQPQQLIGLNMATLLGTGINAAMPRSCPFCRPTGELADEYVHPPLERTFLVSTSQVHAASNEGLQTVHVLKDITDRREAERRYRELFDNIQEGLFFTTPDGRFVEVNDALVRILGYSSREELLQAEVPAQIYSSPERRERLLELVQQHGVLRNHHEALRRRDGSIIHVLLNVFAVRDVDGRVVQMRGLMLDITDLKNFQSELQRERDFSSKILNNTQSLILVADTAGLITYANRRWYQAGGYQHQELLGHPIVDLIAPTGRSAIQDALWATLSGQQVDNLELPVMRADRRTGQFSVNLSP